MHLKNIREAKEWFEVLQTSERAQTAMMRLGPGEASGAKAEGHKESDQVLLMLEGELSGEVGEKKLRLTRGDVLIVPAGVKHRFKNESTAEAVTFNVYSPPEYPPEAKA